MNRIVAPILLACLAVGPLLGCGDDEPGSPAAAQATTVAAPASAATTRTQTDPEPADDPEVFELGEKAQVEGSASDGQQIDLTVTVDKVIDPAPNRYISAGQVEPGTRWVRARVRMKNDAPDTYTIADGSFSVVDDEGNAATENYSSAPWTSLGNGKLLPGDRRKGWVAFVLAKGSPATEIRWEPFIGDENVNRWRIP